jgi:hypothetical protein
MPPVLENRIRAAAPNPAAHTVTLAWANGATTHHDLKSLIASGVFTALADPAIFARVAVGDRGRSLGWTGDIDLCADALWFEAHPEDAPADVGMRVVA